MQQGRCDTIHRMPTIEELLALDLLTLREHTERAGDAMEPALHAEQLRKSLAISHTCVVRRGEALVAYAMINPVAGSSWFVRGFNIHPAHRSAPVIKELMQQVGQLARREGIAELRSHVYQTNRLSKAFHRRLGFHVVQENERAIEYVATVAQLAAASPFIEQLQHAQRPCKTSPSD